MAAVDTWTDPVGFDLDIMNSSVSLDWTVPSSSNRSVPTETFIFVRVKRIAISTYLCNSCNHATCRFQKQLPRP